MIEEFYEFKNSPFTRQLTEDALFLTEEYEETLARLQYASRRQWFALLTGDCGTGKCHVVQKPLHVGQNPSAQRALSTNPRGNIHPILWDSSLFRALHSNFFLRRKVQDSPGFGWIGEIPTDEVGMRSKLSFEWGQCPLPAPLWPPPSEPLSRQEI